MAASAVAESVGPLIRKFADEKAVSGFSRKFASLLKEAGKPDFVRIRDLVSSIRE